MNDILLYKIIFGFYVNYCIDIICRILLIESNAHVLDRRYGMIGWFWFEMCLNLDQKAIGIAVKTMIG